MAVTGAAIVLLRLPSDSAGRSFSLAALPFTNTKRPGDELALVGPHFSRSYIWRSVSSVTGLSPKPLYVRALRKIRSGEASGSMRTPRCERQWESGDRAAPRISSDIRSLFV